MNRIAVINTEGQLETMTPTGRDRCVLSDGRYFYQFPAWSPDSCSIAVIGIEERQGGVFVCDAPTVSHAPLRSIYESQKQQPFYLYWSPDNRYLSFLATHPRGDVALHLVPLSAGIDGSRLIDMGRPYFWAWSLDSQSIFVHRGGGEKEAQLGFIEHPFEQLQQSIAFPGMFQTPGISVSGRYWAYTSLGQDETSHIVIEESQTRRRKRFEHKGRTILSWSPTQDLLAVISPLEDAPHYYGMLRLIDPKSGRVNVLTDDSVIAFFWSPDGQKIAFFTLTHGTDWRDARGDNLYVQEGYARGRPLPIRHNMTEVWLDLNVVDIDSERSQLLTPFMPNPIFLNQYLPFFDQYALSHRLWSPNSKALTLPVIANDREQIVVVPIDGRTPPLAIAEGIMSSWSQQ
ncbi:MAG: hypothetical protein KDE51_20700 [Anaerolineales bacterium]|nr:hypothetical protein [Anaerolineales bacterium]